jgi:hypothetical protein
LAYKAIAGRVWGNFVGLSMGKKSTKGFVLAGSVDTSVFDTYDEVDI